ncbi:hypothetical protein GCM10007857_20620 [Bradyrhizobium iriomotense]|uniref:Uncharacterized protein n=1 Tax=Bradyrhizobium iriomotense TaxID=441950 RepID=A0ABQ6AVT1_9BRAD|nr:hypothetical protein GCM10007857_20620 [Bradyrhizobium iriomotense]
MRETSVAASIARSAMPGWEMGSGMSTLKAQALHTRETAGTGTFGYPRERSF